jgi:hypothetical protein
MSKLAEFAISSAQVVDVDGTVIGALPAFAGEPGELVALYRAPHSSSCRRKWRSWERDGSASGRYGPPAVPSPTGSCRCRSPSITAPSRGAKPRVSAAPP